MTFTIPATFGPDAAHTICVFVFNSGDQTPLTVARQVARKRPLDPPTHSTVVLPKSRKPAFAWPAPASGADIVILLGKIAAQRPSS